MCTSICIYIIGVYTQDVSREATGVLGDNIVPKLDDAGNRIMHGMEAIRGEQEDCESNVKLNIC